jgi:hypothetical protein
VGRRGGGEGSAVAPAWCCRAGVCARGRRVGGGELRAAACSWARLARGRSLQGVARLLVSSGTRGRWEAAC